MCVAAVFADEPPEMADETKPRLGSGGQHIALGQQAIVEPLLDSGDHLDGNCERGGRSGVGKYTLDRDELQKSALERVWTVTWR